MINIGERTAKPRSVFVTAIGLGRPGLELRRGYNYTTRGSAALPAESHSHHAMLISISSCTIHF